jgi:hypothetical protein
MTSRDEEMYQRLVVLDPIRHDPAPERESGRYMAIKERAVTPQLGVVGRMGPKQWRIATAVAVVVLALAATAASAAVFGDHSKAPKDLQQAVNEIFAGGQCTSGADAAEGVNKAFAALGYDGWQVVARPGADSSGCVVAVTSASDNTVVLVPVTGPEISSAMEGVASELMAECLDANEATSLVSSVLVSLGVESFQVSVDGPAAYPSDQKADIAEHLSEGCAVYSGSGGSPDGNPIFYVTEGTG